MGKPLHSFRFMSDREYLRKSYTLFKRYVRTHDRQIIAAMPVIGLVWAATWNMRHTKVELSGSVPVLQSGSAEITYHPGVLVHVKIKEKTIRPAPDYVVDLGVNVQVGRFRKQWSTEIQSGKPSGTTKRRP